MELNAQGEAASSSRGQVPDESQTPGEVVRLRPSGAWTVGPTALRFDGSC